MQTNDSQAQDLMEYGGIDGKRREWNREHLSSARWTAFLKEMKQPTGLERPDKFCVRVIKHK